MLDTLMVVRNYQRHHREYEQTDQSAKGWGWPWLCVYTYLDGTYLVRSNEDMKECFLTFAKRHFENDLLKVVEFGPQVKVLYDAPTN
jgi:hypothetical protein